MRNLSNNQITDLVWAIVCVIFVILCFIAPYVYVIGNFILGLFERLGI